MKQTTLLIILSASCAAIAIALSGCKQAESDNWIKFTPPERDFSVSVPGELVTVPETGDPPGGIPRTRFQLESTGNRYGIFFAVQRLDFPEHTISLKPTAALDGARETAVSAIPGRVLSDIAITLGDKPGREVRVSPKSGNMLATQRIYVVGDHLYLTIAVAPTTQTAEAAVARFLDSFQSR